MTSRKSETLMRTPRSSLCVSLWFVSRENTMYHTRNFIRRLPSKERFAFSSPIMVSISILQEINPIQTSTKNEWTSSFLSLISRCNPLWVLSARRKTILCHHTSHHARCEEYSPLPPGTTLTGPVPVVLTPTTCRTFLDYLHNEGGKE